jgi:ureidoglycolate lyase
MQHDVGEHASREIHALDVRMADFSLYGRVYAMTGAEPAADPATEVIRSAGPGWTDAYTAAPLLGSNGSLGLTRGGPAPFTSTQMERHLLTEEALFCAADPIVLAVAAPTDGTQPRAEDVRAFVITPGTVVVLNKGTWHDACRGIGKDAYYYWMATCGLGDGSPWVEVAGGHVRVTADCPAGN